MKIIISRKGFDSSSGGIPNIILPDNRLVYFPIPGKGSNIRYTDINSPIESYKNIYQIINALGAKNINEKYTAHLDPDLCSWFVKRDAGWKPLFGQMSGAAKHIFNEKVCVGDIFLFFGWFRRTCFKNKQLQWAPYMPDVHMLFGYFSIGDILDLSNPLPPEYFWAAYHPHCSINTRKENYLFVSKDTVEIGDKRYAGAGVFKGYSDILRLTKEGKTKSIWKLPLWFYPFNNNRPPLTFHGNSARWQLFNDHVELKTVGRGQEFVIDTEYYPEAFLWLKNILDNA